MQKDMVHARMLGERAAGRRLVAAMVALALAFGLMPLGLTPHKAYADEGAGKATLTVVAGINWGTPNVVVNKEYAFEQGATVKDLLDAAVAAGDLDSYTLNDYDYVATIADPVGKDLGFAPGYWASYEDGAFYDGTKGTVSAELLEDGVSYQLAWVMTPVYECPDWGSLATPTAETAIAGGDTGSGSHATLSIVSGTDDWNGPNVVVNATFEFAADAKVIDLFDAAKKAGLIGSYELNQDEYLGKVSGSDGNPLEVAGLNGFWMSYSTDGLGATSAYDDKPAEGLLEDGVSYQFSWESSPVYKAPDWAAIAGAEESEGIVKGPNGESHQAAPVNGDVLSGFIGNMKAKYTNTKDPWAAMDLAAVGNPETVDTQGLISDAIAASDAPDSTNLQRYIIAVTAAGLDARAITDGVRTVNLIDALSQSAISHDDALGGVIFALLAYQSGPYDIPANAYMQQSDMIGKLASSQLSDGGFTYAGSVSDADMTAMAVSALAPFAESDSSAKATMQKALACLQGMQLEDGGFPALEYSSSGWVRGSASNPGSTAFAVTAMTAVGLDPATAWATASGATPLSALLSFVNPSQTAVAMYGVDNEMATEQAFRALVAYQGFKNTGSAYNIYVQAKLGQAALTSGGIAETPASDPATNTNAGLAKTDDASMRAIMAASAMLCSAVCLLAAASRARRKGANGEAALR